jgi:hyperosmotically inducible protein
MRSRHRWLNGVVLISVLAVAPVAVQAKTAQIPKGTSEGNDSALGLSAMESAVRHALLMLPYYGVFDNLEFKVEGDKVELTGQVSRPILASDAQRAVEKVAGVSQVINHVEVLPLSPNDDHIRIQVYRRIYGDSSMLLYAIQPVPPIRIIIKNGNVTLEGVVSCLMDKTIANIEANSVAGVFSVTNNIHVQS